MKNKKLLIVFTLVISLLISLGVSETFAAKITKEDFIGNWGPIDPTAKNPFLQAGDGGNNVLILTRYWDAGVSSHEGSRIEFRCKYDGKNILDCDGKKYEYYPIRNGKRIDIFDMTEEELLDENFPTKESLVDNQVHVKYKLNKRKIVIEKNSFTNKPQIKFNYTILEVVGVSKIESELLGSFVKIKEGNNEKF